MLILYLLCSLVKSINIYHDCISNKINSNSSYYSDLDYIVSCPQRSYIELDFFNLFQLSKMYIFGDADIKLKCDRVINTAMPELYIIDDPNIFISCTKYNGTINIFRSPTLRADKNVTFDKVKIYNPSYQYPFKYNKFEQHPSDLIDKIKISYFCSGDLYFYAESEARINCTYSDTIFIDYSKIHHFQIEMQPSPNETKMNFRNYGIVEDNFNEFISLIIPQIKFNTNSKIIFYKFRINNPNYLREILINIDPTIQIVINDEILCNFWTNDEINNAVVNDGWRRFCYDGDGYLFYHGKSEGEIIVIQTRSTVLIVLFIVVVVFVIIISFYLIALCRYKIGLKNDTELEMSDQEDED